jgi:hypothetical protein
MYCHSPFSFSHRFFLEWSFRSFFCLLAASSLRISWAERARQISKAFHPDDAAYLIAAAYFHDIGYAPALKSTGFHPLDGAYYVRSLGYQRLASLVAHHSESRFEARLRGLEPALDEFPRERSAVADALTYCDQTTGPTGQQFTLKERVAEVLQRYGEASVVSQALHLALPYLSLAVARTEQRLRKRGVTRDSSR